MIVKVSVTAPVLTNLFSSNFEYYLRFDGLVVDDLVEFDVIVELVVEEFEFDEKLSEDEIQALLDDGAVPPPPPEGEDDLASRMALACQEE